MAPTHRMSGCVTRVHNWRGRNELPTASTGHMSCLRCLTRGLERALPPLPFEWLQCSVDSRQLPARRVNHSEIANAGIAVVRVHCTLACGIERAYVLPSASSRFVFLSMVPRLPLGMLDVR